MQIKKIIFQTLTQTFCIDLSIETTLNDLSQVLVIAGKHPHIVIREDETTVRAIFGRLKQ
jgi:hypothetical protein